MTAVPTGPINEVPWGLPLADCVDAMHEALTGVELGTYDQRILIWVAEICDVPTIATIASLLHRARAAKPMPEEPAKHVLVEHTDDHTRLRCPHIGCGAFDSIHEVDTAVRFNDLASARFEDGRLIVSFHEDGTGDWSHERYRCAACDRTVLLTEAVRL